MEKWLHTTLKFAFATFSIFSRKARDNEPRTEDHFLELIKNTRGDKTLFMTASTRLGHVKGEFF